MAFIVTPRQLDLRAELFHQLAQLTSAGIGVIPALEQIKRSPPSRSWREPLQRLLDELALGATVTDALRHLDWLPAFDQALIGAGEKSGRLDACFHMLANYYNDRARLMKQVISQLIYPVALIHFAALIFLIVLPFAHSQFAASLPWLFARAALILSPLYGAAVLLVYVAQGKHGENWRSRFESVLRAVPLLGTARRYLALSRLAAALEALVNAGVNIFESWDLAAAASGSPALRRAVAAWKPDVIAGQMPSEAVRACRLFPETFANLYASGEISGKLDESLRNLHRLYGDDGARKLQNFAQLTTRSVYLLVVLIIAWQIIQFYMGLYGPHSDLSKILQGF
ncbi:MAG TPA: type II secretion system F family protein [Candidatus Acidoferrales bacterium]|nr:type II secretion system F family protein [Candidatus Acidoferrales bacterium]